MRKNYPYLSDSYYENANGIKQKRNFLSLIDDFVNQKQYIKITLLNWNEEPIKEIEGELISGTLSKDGSSSVRRTCQFTAVVDKGSYNIDDVKMDFSINKKIYIEFGVKNYTNQYINYPILWFPQGVFFISSCSINSSVSSSININLTLKDKMCGLNGEVGGKFPATVILDEMDSQNPSGQYVTEKVLIYDIIQELVHHYGGEPLSNIVIEDVPLRIKRIMKWTGDNPIYLRAQGDKDSYRWYEVLTSKPEDMGNVKEYPNGADIGYVYSDFVYDTELTANLGETVTSVLDKIKQYLGNFEYFYDEFGVFHFREIKDYLNTSQSTLLLDDMKKKNYLVDVTAGKSVYTFSDKKNLISLTQTPQYENIKNDYIIQGTQQGTSSNVKKDIRYHLAIDKKPLTGNTYYDLLLYKEKDTNLIKAIFPLAVQKESDLPQPGNFNLIYRVSENNTFFYWEDNVYKEVNKVKYYPLNEEGYTTQDWRTELYLQGLLGKNKGTDQGMYYHNLQLEHNLLDKSWLGRIYRQNQNARIDTDFYFEELDAFWPQIYNLETQKFYGQEEDKALYAQTLTDGNYYLDFIEPSTSELGEFSVNNIGRRTDTVVNQDINCLFQPEIPDIIFLNADDDDIVEQRAECQIKGQPYTQVRGEIYSALATGGYKNGAFDQIKYELYLHTNYQKILSLTSLPVFYLEPNSRITIQDSNTNTFGEFVLKTISIPLGAGNNMTVTANQCIERF